MVRRGRPTRTAPTVPQLPWREVTNAHGTLAVLDGEAIEAIHEASLAVLETMGVEVLSPVARGFLERQGATVEGDLVRLDRSIVADAVDHAPPSFTLGGRAPEKRLRIGEDRVAFGLVAGPPAVHDEINGRRASNMADYENFIRLAHYFNAIHIIGNQVAAPMELPANNRHLDAYRANVLLSDLSYHCTAIGRGRALDGIRIMALSRGITPEEMIDAPGVTTVININSPRRLDAEMAEGLMTMAEYGQPVSVTPFTLMGAMTPASLPAALVQQNAEALFGITLAQLVRPGTPVLYGSFTSNVDMRTGSPAFGTPEHAKANVASGQLARRYGLPYRASNSSASNVVDAQAAYETQMSLWGCVLGGANLVYHAAGWMEGGLQASYEKLVLDVEMLQHMMEFLTPLTVTEEDMALDALARVPPGGHFFGDEHTLERYEDAFYAPLVSDWSNHGVWESKGGRTATERATDIWQAALADYEPPPLADDRRAAIDDYVAARKREIGDGAP